MQEYSTSSAGTLIPRGKALFEKNQESQELFSTLDPLYKQLYIRCLHDYPELSKVEIKGANSIQFPKLLHTNGFFTTPNSPSEPPRITINNQRKSAEMIRDLEDHRIISLELLANDLGLQIKTLKDNPEIITLFIFFHEVGHAEDYIKNYMLPHGIRANEEKKTARKTEKESLPIPGCDPAQALSLVKTGELDIFFKNNERYYSSRSIHTMQELLDANERAYRKLPSEAYADNFAAKTIKKNLDIILSSSTHKKIDACLSLKTLPLPTPGSKITIRKIGTDTSSAVPLQYESTSILKSELSRGNRLELQDGTMTSTIKDIKRSRDHIAVQTSTSTYIITPA